jgi:hypothetical protein
MKIHGSIHALAKARPKKRRGLAALLLALAFWSLGFDTGIH